MFWEVHLDIFGVSGNKLGMGGGHLDIWEWSSSTSISGSFLEAILGFSGSTFKGVL
jgi:hypothetical protein